MKQFYIWLEHFINQTLLYWYKALYFKFFKLNLQASLKAFIIVPEDTTLYLSGINRNLIS